MAALTRPLEDDDLDGVQRLDEPYAARFGLDPLVDRATLAYYRRSGHAFVHDDGGTLRGFVMAHAVWDGGRPVVRVGRMVGADEPALGAVLEALVRSAYDAAVYDLVAEVPPEDALGRDALERRAFESRPSVTYARTLGSRGRLEAPR